MSKKNVIIIGAAGRDFQNFNTYYRGNEDYNVVAFTAAQIPERDAGAGVENRQNSAAASIRMESQFMRRKISLN